MLMWQCVSPQSTLTTWVEALPFQRKSDSGTIDCIKCRFQIDEGCARAASETISHTVLYCCITYDDPIEFQADKTVDKTELSCNLDLWPFALETRVYRTSHDHPLYQMWQLYRISILELWILQSDGLGDVCAISCDPDGSEKPRVWNSRPRLVSWPYSCSLTQWRLTSIFAIEWFPSDRFPLPRIFRFFTSVPHK